MTENLKQNNDTIPTEWDSLADSINAAKQELKDNAPERAAYYYDQVRDIEYDFAKRQASLGGNKMSAKEFERWEDAVSDELRQATHEQKIGQMNLDQITEASVHMVTYTNDRDLHKTIEAQAANFYGDRDSALRQAIRASGLPDAEADLRYLNDFYPAVSEHLDFKYMTPSDVRDYGSAEYERQRTRAHNNAMKHLNGLNDLAHKYGTRPFTMRNFLTSDVREKNGQPDGMKRVMRYDRDIVEEYYAIAFSSEVRKREVIQARQMRYGI